MLLSCVCDHDAVSELLERKLWVQSSGAAVEEGVVGELVVKLAFAPRYLLRERSTSMPFPLLESFYGHKTGHELVALIAATEVGGCLFSWSGLS